MQTFELVIVHNQVNPGLGLPLSIWSGVFSSSSERADYLIDVVKQTHKFNAAHPDSQVVVSFLKIDCRDAVSQPIAEYSA